jgi:ribosome-binding protein aMBF1 (putative translation factor)
VSDFSEALLKERCRYRLRRRDVGRALGVLGDEAEAAIRRYEFGDGVPDREQFRQLVYVLPRLLAHPPAWPSLLSKFGSTFDESDRLSIARRVRADIRAGKTRELERPKPLTFGMGLAFALNEDADVHDGSIEVTVSDVGGPAGAKDKLVAWLDDREPPSEAELAELVKSYPTLRGMLATGACRRPQPPHKESTMQQINPVPDKPAAKQLAELIQRARVARERTHRDLANKCNVSQDVVRNWETGDAIPNGREWAKLKGNLYSLGAAQLVWREAIRAQVAEEVARSEPPREPEREADPYIVEAFEQARQAKVDDLVAREEDEEDEEEVGQPQNPNEPPPPPLEVPSAQPSFGQALRVARINLGFTQEELGVLIDTGGSTVSTWENEMSMPTADNWRRLTTALPELKDCTPPGLREVRYNGTTSGPRYARPRTVEPRSDDPRAEPPRVDVRVGPTEANIAKAGVEYAQSLREVTVANERLRIAQEELERAKRAHSAAKTRADEAQRALVKVVEGA